MGLVPQHHSQLRRFGPSYCVPQFQKCLCKKLVAARMALSIGVVHLSLPNIHPMNYAEDSKEYEAKPGLRFGGASAPSSAQLS
eukprot:410789-Amphidinium_carterae.1